MTTMEPIRLTKIEMNPFPVSDERVIAKALRAMTKPQRQAVGVGFDNTM